MVSARKCTTPETKHGTPPGAAHIQATRIRQKDQLPHPEKRINKKTHYHLPASFPASYMNIIYLPSHLCTLCPINLYNQWLNSPAPLQEKKLPTHNFHLPFTSLHSPISFFSLNHLYYLPANKNKLYEKISLFPDHSCSPWLCGLQ